MHVAEHVPGHPAHLNLLSALGDPVAAMVAVDVLERLVPGVTQPAVNLHRPVRGFAAQPVRPVVAHGHLSEAEKGPWVSISQAVLWISARSISHCVCSSTSGNWIAWLAASGLPNGLRSLA